jgi:hypothetical protein
MNDLFKDAKIISSYTRSQALEDGVLIDVSETAREAGFKCSIAVTEGVFAVLNPTEELKAQGQDFEGRLWDLLIVLRWQIGKKPDWTDTVKFAPLFVRRAGSSAEPIDMWAKAGPGDKMELVITVMLIGED